MCVCVKVEIEWDLPLMRQSGKVKMLRRRGFFREMVVGFSLSISFLLKPTWLARCRSAYPTGLVPTEQLKREVSPVCSNISL